jgi:hypothetical protein
MGRLQRFLIGRIDNNFRHIQLDRRQVGKRDLVIFRLARRLTGNQTQDQGRKYNKLNETTHLHCSLATALTLGGEHIVPTGTLSRLYEGSLILS